MNDKCFLFVEGCSFFPSICTNLKLIKSYKKEAEREKSELEKLFVQYSKEYVQLRRALTNNDIITYHTNFTIDSLTTIGNIADEIQVELQSKLLFLSKAASLWEANKTIDVILQSIDSVEYDLEQIQEMLRKHKENALIGIVVSTVIQAAFDRFSVILGKAYSQVLSRQTGGESNIRQKMPWIKKELKKIKLLPHVMKQMGINMVKSIQKTLMKPIGPLKRFFTDIKTKYGTGGIKGALQFSKRKLVATTMGKFRKIANKIKVSVKTLPYRFKSYKMNAISKVSSIAGIAFNVFQIISARTAWENKANIVEKGMQQYRKYLGDLRKEKIKFEEQEKNLSKEWQNALEDFKGISKSLKSLISLLMESNDFLDIVGLMKPPVKKVDPILCVDFQNVTKESVIEMQTNIIGFLNENNNNLTKIENDLTARKISYTRIRKYSEEGKKLKDITDDLKEFYTYTSYDEGRQFGANLKMEDVVCALAIIRKDKVEYDGFQLQPFRPRCEVNDTVFANMKEAAYQERRIIIIDDVIQREITDANIVLSQLKNRISKELSNGDSKNTNSVVTDTDIVCRISILYPNKTEFDFIPLQSFRPSCADVDENMMTTLKSKAVKMRNITESLERDYAILVCKKFKFCQCIPTIRQTLPPGTTDEDIKTTIKRLIPGETEYCGTNGCKCVQL